MVQEQLPPKLPSCPKTNLFANFLTSFAWDNNVPPKCHKWGYKSKIFLLAPLLFCAPVLKMVAPLPVIAMAS